MSIRFGVLILVFGGLFADIGLAKMKSERISGVVCKPRVPKLPLGEAQQVALSFLASRGIKVKDYYIESAKLEYQRARHIWEFDFRRKAYESGLLKVKVPMDKNALMTVVKDG